MPVVCGNASVITGADGMFLYKPSGTQVCLLDNTDFIVTGAKIKLPITHNFRPGDPVTFAPVDGANLDSGLEEDTTYYLGAVTASDAVILTAKGGPAVTLAGDGGTGTADTPGGHIDVSYATYDALCTVVGWTINMTRERIQTTALKCKVGGGGAGKYAPFRKYQSGFADGTGQARVNFNSGQKSLANRMLMDSMLAKQDGAWGKFYFDAVAAATGDLPDDTESLYVEAPLSLQGVSGGVDSASAEATIVTVDFAISGLPKHLFDTALY